MRRTGAATRRWIGVAGAVVLAALVSVPAASAAEPGTLLTEVLTGAIDEFAARFRFVGGTREESARLAAIESSTAEMNALIRGIARRRLKAATEVSPTMTLEVAPEKVGITQPGEPLIEVPASGTAVPWKSSDGDEVDMSLAVRDGRLVLFFDGPRGDQTSVYSLSDDGLELTVDVTITASLLPEPVRYRLTYRRTD